MLSLERGRVIKNLYSDESIQILEVDSGRIEKAVNFININGSCIEGDEVEINTIANRLELGSGGYNFVYHNLSRQKQREGLKDRSFGHIIKMKYTPLQLRVKTIEEFEEYKSTFNYEADLKGIPVIAAPLHSMLPPLICTIKYLKPQLKVLCIYIYGGALNAEYSFILKKLRNDRLIEGVITSGECFGGDYEAVNIYSAMIFATRQLKSDIIVICCGPGISGTSTYYGFSTLEFTLPLYVSKILNCRPILIPRISLEDKRKRHYGISMHTIALLNHIDFPVHIPIYTSNNDKIIKSQLEAHKIKEKHLVEFIDKTAAGEAMDKFGMRFDFMGRKYDDDKLYFENCSASGIAAVNMLIAKI